MINKNLILFSFLSLTIASSNAQIKNTAKPNLYAKFKVPKLICSLGGYKDSSFVSAQIAEAIIGAKLNVVDAKNVAYTLSSYQFLYRKIVVSEDEATGKAYNTTSVKSSLFKTSPLPTMWLNMVRENLRPGEEIIFFDIIVKDAQGRVMYAPNLKLKVK
jgi:hypothetical protein